MRHTNWLAFDDYIQPKGSVVTTSQDLNAKLGMYDQLAIQAVVDNVASNGTGFKVQILHSSDGRNWLLKAPGVAEIGGASGVAISAGTVNSFFGKDDGTIPSLALVQLQITLGTSTGAHVRIHVTGRDWGR